MKIICFILLAFISFESHSIDLEREDPRRKELLDRIRADDNYAQYKFDVKRIWSDGVFAYVCAFPVSADGAYKKPYPDHFEVIEYFFRYRYNWNGDVVEQHLVQSIKENPCLFKPQDEITAKKIEEQIQQVWKRSGTNHQQEK